MGVFTHHRSRIFNQAQHPFKHGIDDFAYSSPAFGSSVTTLQQALDWIVAVLYPTQKPAVADVASLPAAGNTIGDMRVVNDSGDGRSASYRWEQREGDAVAKWYKIYDVDFSTDSILAAWTDVTQDVYAVKYGRDDTDSSGSPVSGVFSGQSLYGGKSANTNLSLFANSGDGVGASTGYVQFGDNVRPTTNGTLTLGTASNRWSNFYSDEAYLGDFHFLNDTIDSLTGFVDLIDNDLVTTGMVSADHVVATVSVSQFKSGTTIGNLTLSNGSIVSSGTSISFGSNDLVTTGDAQIGNINIVGDTISADLSVIDFLTNDLTNINTVEATGGELQHLFVGSDLQLVIDVSGNISHDTSLTIGATTSLILNAGTLVDINAPIDASSTITAGGTVTAPIFVCDTTSGDITIGFAGNNSITSNGAILNLVSSTGIYVTTPWLAPTGFTDLGSTVAHWRDLYLYNSIKTLSHTISASVLECLRNANTRKLSVAPSNGDTLFWDTATQSWYADHPDSEIDHGELTGLADDDHAQYLNKNGRAGGQVAIGGTATGENLVLASTSHASKGKVLYRDVLAPESDGTDLGTATKQVGDFYIKGQGIGFRAENTTTVTLPSASASKVGRIVFDQTAKTLLVDDGGTWRRAGAEKAIIVDAAGWTGSVLTLTYTVSSSMQDATKAVWDFCLTSTGERLYPVITKTTTQVTVTFKMPPPAASYTLIGVA